MKTRLALSFTILFIAFFSSIVTCQTIPLPEHPRPDFQRPEWINLNGTWNFAFDPGDVGLEEGWAEGKKEFQSQILVPFPWGSKLSGLENEADIGWYSRNISVDPSWKGKRIFLTIGASDWKTEVWLDGQYLGMHQGGYVPFSFDLTDDVNYGQSQKLVIRVDDARRDFTLYGKQGYGDARGIWQTVYLEARGNNWLDALHFAPDIDDEKVQVTAYLPGKTEEPLTILLSIETPGGTVKHEATIPKGSYKLKFNIPLPSPRLWSLEDPYLYNVHAQLQGGDELNTYFGMRKISVENLPGTDYQYIALNGEPVYLQLALDQSYHPDGFYTFPSDDFMREEILRSKSIGLNGIRTHIKVEVPRKLYWADKLGLLVMEDLPNSWGEPDKYAQAESEYTMRQMIHRDFNHPSIFSWVMFNETWGLFSNVGTNENGQPIRSYLPETQDWVASMYYLAKSLDQTRLVEDNSICCGRGHTETDINSWHQYLPGWEWDEHLKTISDNTFKGSTFHFEEGFEQGLQPNINSECGNVWGYEGSTGDVDWSWDYHRMINTFRMYPKIAGWLYTEHHDVINEWNGYWRFDRSEKFTGLDEIMDGMSLLDFHSDVYLSMGNEISRRVNAGDEIEVPPFISVMTGKDLGTKLSIDWRLEFINRAAESVEVDAGTLETNYIPWMQKSLNPLKLEMPDLPGLAVLKVWVKNSEGNVLHRNFMHFIVEGDATLQGKMIIDVAPDKFTAAEWTKKQWEVLEGRKINGAGEGYFKYSIPLNKEIEGIKVKSAEFIIEVSAKELFVKDMAEYDRNQDFMRGSRVYPSANPNAYPMTDEIKFPSDIVISLNDEPALETMLQDDPADHRGVLSWHYQLQDKKLREAGSYGYLVRVPVSKKILKSALEEGRLEVELKTKGEGGIAVYGKEFGRYPFNPSLVLHLK